MKKSSILLALILLVSISTHSQEEKKVQDLPQLGEKAPKIVVNSTQGKMTFPNDFKKNWKILFSHPADFTPVCTSELLELAHVKDRFSDLGVQFAVISTDKLEHHKLWVESMNGLTYKGRSNAKIDFPLIADPKGKASMEYGMIHPKANSTKNVRGVFVIDPQNKIRAIMYYPMAVGRNMDEIERTVLALQKHDRENVLTPANWAPGKDVIVPFLSYTPELDTEEAKNADPSLYSVAWYLHMKKDDK